MTKDLVCAKCGAPYLMNLFTDSKESFLCADCYKTTLDEQVVVMEG